MPPGLLRREMGMLRHCVAADSPAAAVRGPAGWLIVDRRDAKHHSPACADCRRLYMNCIIIRHLPVRSTGI